MTEERREELKKLRAEDRGNSMLAKIILGFVIILIFVLIL